MSIKNKIYNTIISSCKYAIHKNTDKLITKTLEIAKFDKISQNRVEKLETIVFVTPYMTKHSGGLTSVLRIAKRLTSKGLSVYFTCPTSNDCSKMIENAKVNLSDYIANYITWETAKTKKFDFVIPVQDIIVYYARNLKGYLIYFVQDYEPYFNPIGDRYFLSKKAYELGEDIISLGQWNIQEIKKNLNSDKIGDIYAVEFPFEASEYPYSEKKLESLCNKNEISIAVYIKRESKRLPCIIMNLLEKAYIELKKQDIELKIYYFGLHKVEKPAIGTNLGRIKKKEIKDLYDKCDFGLVASMTNISLVPYEMIGSGLPVIEFADGSYSCFLGEDTAILLNSFDSDEFIKKLLFYKNNTKSLSLLCKRAKSKIENLSWDKTGQEFYEILRKIVDNYNN